MVAALYFSFCFTVNTCAVPVLPALTYCAPAKLVADVPSMFTPTMLRLMISKFSGKNVSCPTGSLATDVDTLVSTSTTSRTKCGFIFKPLLANVPMACATCNMVKLL